MNYSHSAFDGLNSDWERLSESADADVVRGWLIEAGALPAAGAPDSLAGQLVALERRDRTWGRAHSDLWMTALLVRVADGSALAARVLVQAMLPSAVMTARTLRGYGLDWDEAAQIAVASLYEVVLTYPLSRRPQRVAANVSMDTLRVARREAVAEAVLTEAERLEEALAEEMAASDPGVIAQLDLAELLEEAAAAGLADADAPAEQLAGARGEMVELLLWALRARVLAADEVAELGSHYSDRSVPDRITAGDVGVSEAAVRKRRSRAVLRLRAAAPAWRQERDEAA